ncbi:molybdate metabolism regulator [Gottfriedia sp. NPDC057991]
MLEKLEQKGLMPASEMEFDWDEEDSDGLKAMFPKLWARFGENPLG